MAIKFYLEERKQIIEKGLDKYFPTTKPPFNTHIEAMRYSLFVGGKRIRPILCLASGEAVSQSRSQEQNLLPVACALECIHTYSLIHDDLPAMDNDEMRRGKPTNHMIYGDAGAILAGDGLLTWAFDLLSDPDYCKLPPNNCLRIIQVISRASGSLGMVGGQALDIENENTNFPFSKLQTIHKNKTGALITASILAGAIGAEATQAQYDALQEYGNKIGLAFQIVDDLLDATSTTEELGKTAGSDEQRGKATYPAFFGIDKTREKAQETVNGAIAALELFGPEAAPLRELAEYIYARSH